MKRTTLSFLGLLASSLPVACSSSNKASTGSPSTTDSGPGGGNKDSGGGGTVDSGGSSGPGFSAAALAELRAKHVDKYITPVTVDDTTTNADGDTVFNFDPTQGPMCYLGTQYHVITHDAHSENLLIFLQGGGACWTDLCAVVTPDAQTAITKTGIIDEDTTGKNPVGDWNIVYAPYCDGSVFAGDNDTTGPQGQAWHFHGLANLTAAINAAKKTFPNPKRILLAGSSAGGYGTLAGTGIVRLEYPNTKLDVLNDAGLGLSNPNNATMLPTIKRDWKLDQFLPDSCTECQTGQVTAIIAWGLKADPTLRVSAFSSYQDAIIGGTFLQMSGPDFQALLMTESAKIHDAYPDRFERFFYDGSQHTILLAGAPGYYDDVAAGDGGASISVANFAKAQLNGDPAWTDHLQ